MGKIEKTLDEQVMDRLGAEYHHPMIDGFFTGSIANCKKHIEPVLLRVKGLIELDKCECGEAWIVQGRGVCPVTNVTRIFFNGIAETEEIAYCKALLDLKARDK